ncbi:MAG: zinc-ribbon and DUF3426 domain-containing protein [Rhodanobacteraceae bacterium]
MYTQCPECLTIYAVDASALAQAHGSVRCGHCTMVFDALPSLSEALPPEHFAGLPARAPGAESPLLVEAVFRAVPDATEGGDPGEVTAPAITHATPAFARPRAQRTRGRNLRWMAGCGVLALLLVAQLAWANRTWLADAGLRPVLARFCATLSCTLPPLKDISRLTLLSRDIRPHPSVPGALIISATIRNDADFTQPYPVIRIALSDLDGNAIAMRRFRPSEYIGDSKTRTAGLPPGGTVAAVFEVEDPGKNAVAFEFGFE